uniref:Uncharacterized protein n=1 Tax=Anopheles darlingi TaxID=43151 RepID=A0A2M4CXI1_ANODA
MSCGRFVRFLPALTIIFALRGFGIRQLDGDAPRQNGSHIVQTLVAVVLLRIVNLRLHRAESNAITDRFHQIAVGVVIAALCLWWHLLKLLLRR